MSFLSKLLGLSGGAAPAAKSTEYQGFEIMPAPMKEGSKYRICAEITKEVDGEMLRHTLVRADVFEGLDQAEEATLRKAKQVIDEQGDRLFR